MSSLQTMGASRVPRRSIDRINILLLTGDAEPVDLVDYCYSTKLSA
jgi:hypothetical protein